MDLVKKEKIAWKIDGKLPTKQCQMCKVEVPVKSRDRWERTKYCSKECMYEGIRSKPAVYKNSPLLPCTSCGLILERSMFGKDASRRYRGGAATRCIPCSREHSKKYTDTEVSKRKKISARFESKYGINLIQYEKLFEEHKGLCAICNKPSQRVNKNGELKRLAVDHDHKTGKVRGLLCFDCNTGLGKFGDDVEMLSKALSYLKNTNITGMDLI
jgi:hypothetical protein